MRRRLLGLLLLASWLPLQHAQAQVLDLVLDNMTISTAESFEAINSITAGPTVMISSTGDVTFRTKKTALVPSFMVLQGGQLRIIADITVDVESEPESGAVPTAFAVHQNYPNPFNPSTTLFFDLDEPGEVRAEIIDMLGRVVHVIPAQPMTAGAQRTLSVDMRDLASGAYLYRVIVQTPTTVKVGTGRMVLLK